MNGKCFVWLATGLVFLAFWSVPVGAIPIYTYTYWRHDPAAPGDWFEATNWTLGVLPTSSDRVYITNGGEAWIAAGNAEADPLYLGFGTGESGALTQTGGTNTLDWALYLGYFSGAEGTYELSGTGSLSANDEFIGEWGTGTFTQTGGTNTAYNLYLGASFGGKGTYELSGTGSLSAHDEFIGNSGTGTFTQTGGTHTIGWALYLGYSGSEGTYELSGTGSLSAYKEVIGHFGTGTFTQTGGTNTVGDYLYLGCGASGSGTYNLSGTGSLSANDVEYIGYEGTGTFTQTGGTHTVGGDLYLGRNSGGEGTYELSGTGSLSADDEFIGYSGTGTFTQTGGTNTVTSSLYLGRYSGSNGTYTISAGSLSAADFIVGSSGSGGMLNITDSAANITVSNLLRFGGDSTLTAVPGATIHMTGAAFENRSTDPAALAGLANLELIFEGGAADWDPFEVASLIDGGFADNFALGTLMLGGSDVGLLQLVDFFDNGNRGTEGMECLFTHALTVNDGSELDLNGLWLYVDGNVESILDGWIGDGRLFDSTGISLNAMYDAGHDWTLVPEPATLSLLALGGLGLIARRRRCA